MDNTKTILIVDDQPVNLKVLLEVLKKQQFHTLVADSGERALATLEKTEPDLILLDVMMPGMDGFQACRRIKENKQWSGIPIIFITALEDIESKLQGFHAGAVDYITKPFQQVEVIARVSTHLALRRKTLELAETEKRLADILEFLPDPTLAIDNEGRVILWNRHMAEYTGISKKEILGKDNYAHAIPFYGRRRPTLANLALSRNPELESGYIHLSEQEGTLAAEETFCPGIGKSGAYISAVASKLFDSRGNLQGAIQSIRDISKAKKLEQERETLIEDLQAALKKVKTLSGMLPICTSCKKIRDDEGYRNQIENYLREHTDTEFSHSLCQDCTEKLYGHEDWFLKMKKSDPSSS